VPVDGGFRIDWEGLGIGVEYPKVATGYGREMAQLTGADTISEILAHTDGAALQTGLDTFVLIDLGGQDSKVIVVRKGEVADFWTNDRCAASTGRYLENMARILKLSLDEIAGYHENPVVLSTVCAVFGESELLAKMANGIPVERLAAGVNHALVSRFEHYLDGYRNLPVVLTGGLAKSAAIRNIVESRFQRRVVIPKQSQFNGALGCLLQIAEPGTLQEALTHESIVELQ